jgi:hypothetical protein
MGAGVSDKLLPVLASTVIIYSKSRLIHDHILLTPIFLSSAS